MAFAKALYFGIDKADLDDLILIRYKRKTKEIVRKVEDNLQLVGELEMEMEDLQIFAIIDGEKTLAEIIVESGFETAKVMKVIFSLEMLGIVSIE